MVSSKYRTKDSGNQTSTKAHNWEVGGEVVSLTGNGMPISMNFNCFRWSMNSRPVTARADGPTPMAMVICTFVHVQK